MVREYAHQVYVYAVELYGDGDRGHLVVGNLALAFIFIVTCLGVWYVLREVSVLGLKLLKIIIEMALVLLFACWTLELYQFVYPNDEVKVQAKQLSQETLDDWGSYFHSMYQSYFSKE